MLESKNLQKGPFWHHILVTFGPNLTLLVTQTSFKFFFTLHMCSLLALVWCNALHSCVHQLWPPVLPDCGWLIHFHLYTSRWEIPSVFPPFLFSGHSEWMNSARLKSFTPGHAQRGFSLTLTDSHIYNSSSSSHSYTIAAAQELCHSNDTRRQFTASDTRGKPAFAC